jgi:hypothetical protein
LPEFLFIDAGQRFCKVRNPWPPTADNRGTLKRLSVLAVNVPRSSL